MLITCCPVVALVGVAAVVVGVVVVCTLQLLG